VKFIERNIRRLRIGGYVEDAVVRIEDHDLVEFTHSHAPLDSYYRARLMEEHPTLIVKRSCRKDGRPFGYAIYWLIEPGVTCCGPYALRVRDPGEVLWARWKPGPDGRIHRRAETRDAHGELHYGELESKGPYAQPKRAAKALNAGCKTSKFYAPRGGVK